MSNNQTYLDAAKEAGNFIVSTPISPTQGENGFNVVFLQDLATATGNSTYLTKANNILASIFTGNNKWAHNNGSFCSATTGCTPTQLVAAYANYRSSNRGMVPYDVAPFVLAEVHAGNTAFAQEIEAAIIVDAANYNSSASNYEIGLANKVIAAAAVDDVNLSSYVTELVSSQHEDGSFGLANDGQVQMTSYALRGLSTVGGNVNAVNKATTFLNSKFGSPYAFDGWKDTSGPEYAEGDSEAMHALKTQLTSGTYYTIQDAINAAIPDDTINVAAGTYAEQVLVNKQLTINGSKVGISAGVNAGTRGTEESIVNGFLISKAPMYNGTSVDGTVIDGFTVLGGYVFGSHNDGFAVESSGDLGITIQNNIIQNVTSPAQSNGIENVSGTNNLTIKNNKISNNYRGIYLNPASGVQITGNIIDSNNGVGVGIGSSGQSNLTISGNTISGHTVEGFGSDNVGVNVAVNSNEFINNTAGVDWYPYPDTGNKIDATNNWWGSSTGPTIASNAGGTGDKVNTNVNYKPWCTDSGCTTFSSTVNVSTLDQLKTALDDTGITTINITADISAIPATLVVPVGHAVTINGGGKTLTFTGLASVVGNVDDGFMIQASTTINNLIVDAGLVTPTAWVGTYAIQVYNTTATLNNVTAKNGNGGILDNNSVVTLTGAINVSGNGMGGIELGLGTGLNNQPTLTVTDATFTNTTEAYGLPTIWEDGVSADRVIGGSFTKITKETQPQYYLIAGNSIDPAVTLTAAQTSAVTELGGYKTLGDYSADNQTIIGAKIATGTTAINNAVDLAGVDTALATAKADLDTVKTLVTEATEALVAEVSTFESTNSVALALTVDTVALTDKTIVDVAISAYGSLSASAQTAATADNTLLENLSAKITDLQNAADATALSLTNATTAVVTAEGSHLQADVDVAQTLVTALPDGTDKDGLNARINGVQVLTPVQQYATTATTTLENDTTSVVLDAGSNSVKEIIVPATISSTQEITLDMSSLLVDSSDSVTLGSNDMTLERQGTNNYSALLPAGTVITGDSNWNGNLILPTITTLMSSVGTVNVAVEMGSTQRLNFSNAVKVVLGGMTGKSALYSDGTGEHTISACTDASDTTAGSLATGGECSISVGNDLVIWTYHFTTFAAYTPTPAPVNHGGGASFIAPCSDVTYGEWETAINGIQYRDIIKQAPNSCALTATQQSGRSRAVFLNNGTVRPETPANNNSTNTKKVLGVKVYADGTLLKGTNNKIYVVNGNALQYISSLKELTKYRGPILKVSDDVIASFSETAVLGVKKYADGTLLKGTNNKIYVVNGNALQYIVSLKELAKYTGPTLKVSDEVISSFSKTAVLGAKKYTDGTLIKAKGDVKIYVIKDGKKVHVKSLAELKTYKGKTLIVEASELNNY